MQVVQAGGRGVIFFVVQREDAGSFGPADSIDPDYGNLLRHAVQHGVEAYAYQVHIRPPDITLNRRLPIYFGKP